MTCRPPPGTAEETLHILVSGSSEKTFLWRNGCWNRPSTGWGTKWPAMQALGWRYKKTAEPDPAYSNGARGAGS